MARYLLHRLGRTAAVLVAVTVVLYLALELQPGSFERAVCGPRACPDELAEGLASTYAFDGTVWHRAFAFLRATVTLDFGSSLTLAEPAGQVAVRGIGASGVLVLLTVIVQVAVVAVVVAVDVAGRGRWSELATRSLGTAAIILPLFWVGMVLRAVVGAGTLPAAFALALVGTGVAARRVHQRVLDGLTADHVRLARTYGVPERRIALRHGVLPAVPQALGSFAASTGVVLGGLVLLEPVFGRDGVGAEIAAAIARQDRPVVLAGVYVLLVTFVILRSALLIAARLSDSPRVDRWAVA